MYISKETIYHNIIFFEKYYLICIEAPVFKYNVPSACILTPPGNGGRKGLRPLRYRHIFLQAAYLVSANQATAAPDKEGYRNVKSHTSDNKQRLPGVHDEIQAGLPHKISLRM